MEASAHGAARAARRRRPVWAGRDFSLLTGAAFVTSLCGAGAPVAAAFAVLRGGGSGVDIGVVTAARTAALVVFLLVGGAVADQVGPQRVMVAANTVNCASQALFAVLVLTGHPPVWQMALLSAVGGAGQAFFSPAAESLLLASVETAHSGPAFAFYRMAVNGATIGGAGAAGALIAGFGPGWVLAIDATGFAGAALLRSFLSPGARRVTRGGGGVFANLRDGWREFTARRWLWAIVAQFSVINAVFTAAEAVYGPVIAQRYLGGAVAWGLALTAFGLGTLLGGAVMTRWHPRRPLFTGMLCVFPLALPPAALAIVPSVPVICGAMLVSGLTLEVFGVGWMVALRQEVPVGMLSRVAA